MKVFLSHSTKDAEFVKKLAAAMKGNGFEPWACEVEIDKGANFVAEISRGLKDSDLLLLVWSPDAAKSAWTEAEWTSALKQQVEESRIRLCLVMFRKCELPPLLATTNYIDATRDPEAGIRDAIDWLSRRENAQRLSGLNAPVYLPDYRSQDFVGRTEQLARLSSTLCAEPSALLLHGEPGVGKSTLALQLAWTAQKDFDAVVFQTCGHRPLDTITAELASRLPIGEHVKTLPPDKQREETKTWLRRRQSLLILDDVWPNGDGHIDIRELEPGPACSVLYTSRLTALPGITPKQTSKVEKFTDAEAEELFHIYLDDPSGRQLYDPSGKKEVDKNKKNLLDFAARVEMLPIAVAVGASLLRDMSAMSLSKAVSKLNVSSLSDAVKNVNNLFAQAIESQPAREQKLLAACSICVQEGFWLPLAAHIAELSEDDADEAANVLVRGSLLRVLDRDRRRFQLHALLRNQLLLRAGALGLTDLKERHAAVLEALFKDWETRWQEGHECLAEIIPTSDFLGERGEAYRAWQLSYKAYKTGKRTGDFDNAFRIMRHENELAFQRGDNVRLESSCSNLANIFYVWGNLEEAMRLHKKQGEICEEIGDEDGLQRSYGNQAGILHTWGRPKEAMALLKKQEAICIRRGDVDSLRVNYGNQATLLRGLGRLQEAMDCCSKMINLCLGDLSNKDALQGTIAVRASILKDLGQLENAFANLRDREGIAAELGDKLALQGIYGEQAEILIGWGRYDEARELLVRQEAVCKELGYKAALAYCYGVWSNIDAIRGDSAAQREKLQQALALYTELEWTVERDAVNAQLDYLTSAGTVPAKYKAKVKTPAKRRPTSKKG